MFFSFLFFFVCVFHLRAYNVFLHVYSINEYKKMDILTCCLLSKKFLFFLRMTVYANHKQLWMNGKKKKKTFHFISIPCTLLLFGRYIQLADMSFIFVFNTVEEAFTDDWIFRYFLSLYISSFCLIAFGILGKIVIWNVRMRID